MRAVVPYTATLYAVDSIGARAVVQYISLELRVADTDVPAYGPHGQACAHGNAVDAVPFDYNFKVRYPSLLAYNILPPKRIWSDSFAI